MMDTTLRNAFLGADSLNPALKSVANVQKTTPAATDKTQDFGAVLDKTAQKFEQKSEKTQQITTDNSAKPKEQPPEKTIAETESDKAQNDEPVEDTGVVADEKTSQMPEVVKESGSEAVNKPIGKMPEAEEPVDEMTIDEIASALEQIIGQIKEILGIADEELLSGMEDLGLQPYDLLNTGNMTQLVTTISGEGSTISLVANEDLYTALQDITEVVDTRVNELLDKTGLTSEELGTVLQKLQEQESRTLQDQIEDMEILPLETVEETVAEEHVLEEPVIIREDHTEMGSVKPDNAKTDSVRTDNTRTDSVKADNVKTDSVRMDNAKTDSVKADSAKTDSAKMEDQSTNQYDKLPENQQENSAEIGAKPQTQSTGKDTKDSDDKESKNFGQDHTSQNFQNNLNEMNDAAAVEGVEKFTSESTENLMRQLADMVKIVKNENLTEMELQLHPASLGTVNVSLTTKGGMVTAEFTTQNEAVKAAIEAQATQLRANLEEQGVRVEAIEVSVESHQMERNLDKNGQEQQRQAQEQETGRIQGMRRGRSSINLRAFANGEELEGEMQGADDATRIAMEIMAANGNTMDLLA